MVWSFLVLLLQLGFSYTLATAEEALIAGGFNGTKMTLVSSVGLDRSFPDVPQPTTSGSLTAVESILYFCGGSTVAQPNGTELCYTLDLQDEDPSWNQSITLPVDMISHVAIATTNNHIWFVRSDSLLFDFDTQSQTFTNYSLPFTMRHFTFCSVTNGTKVYFVGVGEANSEIWVSEDSSDPSQWTHIDGSFKYRYDSACVWLEDEIYVTGGSDMKGRSPTANALSFNFNSGQTSQLANINQERCGHEMFIHDGKPAVIGGYNYGEGAPGLDLYFMDTIETYDKEEHAWSVASDLTLTIPRAASGLAQLE